MIVLCYFKLFRRRHAKPNGDEMSSQDVLLQREYYRRTASEYDNMHVASHDEHALALAILSTLIEFNEVNSILDIGSGTGRALKVLQKNFPERKIVGIEPSKELREIAYSNGVDRKALIDGNACALPFEDGEFDLVCEFGVLHHIRDNGQAVTEMIRVARRGLFISDCNNFGQGSFAARSMKQILHGLRLWPLANFVKTKGRGYSVSEGDGISYSYSLFDSEKRIKTKFPFATYMNTVGTGRNFYRSASHVAAYYSPRQLARPGH